MNIKDLIQLRNSEIQQASDAKEQDDEAQTAVHNYAAKMLAFLIEQERNTTVQVIEKTVHNMYPNHPGRAQRLAVGQIRRMDVRSGYAEQMAQEGTA